MRKKNTQRKIMKRYNHVSPRKKECISGDKLQSVPNTFSGFIGEPKFR
jgi:hypothetical protein